jgi:hypothetical protein
MHLRPQGRSIIVRQVEQLKFARSRARGFDHVEWSHSGLRDFIHWIGVANIEMVMIFITPLGTQYPYALHLWIWRWVQSVAISRCSFSNAQLVRQWFSAAGSSSSGKGESPLSSDGL